MENIAQKIKALDYSEEMKATLPKFLATLVARDPETGKEVVTTEEIAQIVKYLKEKGISLRPSHIKVLANGFSYIKKSVEEVEKLGELKIYIDDPSRITSDETAQRIKYLRDHKIEYKSAEGKYSKLAYSKRAFEAEFGAIDFTTEQTKAEPAKEVKPEVKAPETPKAEPVKAEEKAPEKAPAQATEKKVEPKPVEAPKAPENKPVEQKAETKPAELKTEVKAEEAKKEVKVENKPTEKVESKENKPPEAKPASKMEINPEPRKDAPKYENGKIEVKIPVISESPAEKLNLGGVEKPKAEAPKTETKPAEKAPVAPEKKVEPKTVENKKIDNAPKNIKPVTPVKPQEAAKHAAKPEEPKVNKTTEEKVPTALNKDESMEYTGELDLASLEASFNDHKEEKAEDELVKSSTVELAKPHENRVYTPYDEILSKPQTIALTDETFERYERLSDSIRRVLTTVYNMTEITDNITDNLIKLITAGVVSDAEVMFYSITYGKNISEEETQHLRSSIEEELEYIKIFDINPDGQGRAA